MLRYQVNYKEIFHHKKPKVKENFKDFLINRIPKHNNKIVEIQLQVHKIGRLNVLKAVLISICHYMMLKMEKNLINSKIKDQHIKKNITQLRQTLIRLVENKN